MREPDPTLALERELYRVQRQKTLLPKEQRLLEFKRRSKLKIKNRKAARAARLARRGS